MSTSRPRTHESRLRQSSPPPAVEVPSGLRADLESVWSISASDGTGAGVDAVLTYAGNILQQEAEPGVADALVVLVAEIAGLSEQATRRALFRHAVRRLLLGRGDPAVSIGSQLRLLVTLAPVAAASVWLPAADGSVSAVAFEGSLATTRRCKRAAAFAIAGDDVTLQPHGSRVRIHAYPLRRRDRRDGALVVRLGAESYPEALPYLEEFALVFGAVLERELLLRASSSDERRLGETYERRLVRTAFDLHDGPLQDVASLAVELRSLHEQIAESGDVPREVLLGRLDDVASRVVELDQSLRAISQSLETSTVAERPLLEALRREVDLFERRARVAAELQVSGALDTLTMSQRIAIVRVVQEALNNAKAHSGAAHVEVTVRASDDGVDLTVRDDGRGFDLRATAAAAARRGRLGIVGMHERIRLLGGTFSIESAPGVGTTVTASIPAWRPLPGA
jgi:signal transduction histidine kinase